MANLSSWYDDVMPFFPGLPTAMADWAIRQGAIEFCDRSHAHIEDLTTINSVAGTADYALSAPSDTEIVKVIAVAYDGAEIKPISPRDVARRYGDDWADLQEDPPERYLSQYGTSLKLIPKPATSVTGAIVPTAVLRPTWSATTVSRTIATPFKRQIAMGARKTLWLMPKKPWSDMPRGTKEEADFFEACAQAHIIAHKGRTGATMRVRNFYYPKQ